VQVRLPFTSPIVGLSAGAHHCLAVTEDGNAYGWGSKESFRTGVSEYRVYTGPLEYGVGEGPTEYVSFPDEDVYAPMLLRLADHCGPETERVHMHAASAGGIHSLFLVQRVASAVGVEALKQWQQPQDQNSQANMEEDAGAASERPTKRARVLEEE
jgi:alpha-tubulin suppressor-like RCC1 family protein